MRWSLDFLRWFVNIRPLDRIANETIRKVMRVAAIRGKLGENRLDMSRGGVKHKN